MQEIVAEQESCAKSIVKHVRGSPMLIVLCGPSHVGKTTFAQRLGKHFKIISSEEIRKELVDCFERAEAEAKVWNVFEAMKCQALKERDNVILDACHMSKRARWHAMQGPNGHHRKICVVFDLPLRTIRDRCLKAKRVSLKEVERMWRDFKNSMPTREQLKLEGFAEVYFVSR